MESSATRPPHIVASLFLSNIYLVQPMIRRLEEKINTEKSIIMFNFWIVIAAKYYYALLRIYLPVKHCFTAVAEAIR